MEQKIIASRYIKEVLTIPDIMAMFDVGYQEGAKIIRGKRRKSDGRGREGRCHIKDYMGVYALPVEMYLRKEYQNAVL